MAKTATKTNAKPASQSKAVSFVAANAISADAGQKAMASFQSTKETDAEIAALSRDNTIKKYETLKGLTQSFVKAALADKTIDLGAIHSDQDKEVSTLRTKLEVATGIKVASKNADGTDKFSLADWTKDYLPQPGEDKTSDVWRKKENFRTNFAAVFKKSILAAHAIVLKGLTVKEDKETGVLMISGKAIKERFNVDQVALNEQRTIKDGDKEVKLAKIPSYTELGRISAESAGKTVQTRVQSAAKLGGATLTEKDVLEAVKSLQTAISKLKGFGDELASAMEGLSETIDNALSNNEGSGS